MSRNIPFTNTLQVMEYDRENWINEEHRHCRIGKVTRKYLPTHLRLDNAPMAPAWNETLGLMALGKCSCLPGQACGNVACPYKLHSTCVSGGGNGSLKPFSIWVSA